MGRKRDERRKREEEGEEIVGRKRDERRKTEKGRDGIAR